MLHAPRAQSDEIRADNIESGKDVLYRGLVGAIIHVTRADLEKLGEAYKEATAKSVSKDAHTAEKMVMGAFSPVIPELSKMGGMVELDLSLEMKEKLKGILPAIQYLYTLRYGGIKGGELNTLLNTDMDEPYVLIFHIQSDANGRLSIKKMLLEKSNVNTPLREKPE